MKSQFKSNEYILNAMKNKEFIKRYVLQYLYGVELLGFRPHIISPHRSDNFIESIRETRSPHLTGVLSRETKNPKNRIIAGG